MSKCEICGTELKKDLFSLVTNEQVCSICKIKYIGGLPTTSALINKARKGLGLGNGKYLEQNNPEEARQILGR